MLFDLLCLSFSLNKMHVTCDATCNKEAGSEKVCGVRKSLRLLIQQWHFELSRHPVDHMTSDLASSMHLSCNKVEPLVRPQLQRLLD
jgi:hypothetical protein